MSHNYLRLGHSLKTPFLMTSMESKDRQRILSFYVQNSAFASGPFDLSAELYRHVSPESVEGIKYVMHTAGPEGIYYTVVFVEKKESSKGVVGFAAS